MRTKKSKATAPAPEAIDQTDAEQVGTQPEAVETGVPEPTETTVTDPAGGALVRDCTLAITGLPGSALAYTWAIDLARVIIRREPAHALTILDKAGAVLFTIDRDHLAAVKAAKASAGKAKKAENSTFTREPKTAPDGKRLQVVQMCMKAEGASAKELVALTGWHKAPWRWTIGNNKNGTGLADKFGYRFRSEKVGDEVRYFLTPAAEPLAA
jgi:hypothetical protein